jgi:SpoVK/Ycf46/Vps4 family AAA+-type ATPase
MNPYTISETTSKTNLSNVFERETTQYLNHYQLYLAHFNFIPNSITIIEINCDKAIIWFKKQFEKDLKFDYFNLNVLNKKQQNDYDEHFFFLFEDLLVNFDYYGSKIRLLFSKTNEKIVAQLKNDFLKFEHKAERNKPTINVFVNNSSLNYKRVEIEKTQLSIKENYNDDFAEINDLIVNRLSKKKEKGIVLLHGKPGTGKTSYIRYLISQLCTKKEVFFLPTNIVHEITNPSFMTFLIENANSILVIEDAEKVILERGLSGSSAVSSLLNLADGLLSDFLKIQIICTFNTDVRTVDKALIRKGRLIANYEFKELNEEKAQSLSNKIGFKTIINKPMTLSEIYNQNSFDFESSNKTNNNKIGF